MSRLMAVVAFVVVACASLIHPAVARADEDTGFVKYGRGFEIHSADGNFRLNIRGGVQPRFALSASEDGVDALGFRIRRGRIAFDGHVFTPNLRYTLQFETVSPALLDYHVEVVAGGGLSIRAGQYKIPYSRQYLNSSSALQLIERSTVVSHFTTGARLGPDGVNLVDRDVGLMASWRGGPSNMLFLRAGMFNGEGIGSRGTVDTDLAYAARLDVAPLGRMPDEGVPQPHDTRFNVGLSAVMNSQPFIGNATQTGLDVAFATGGLFTTAEVHFRQYRGVDDGVQELGFFVQAGYLVLPDPAIEVAARYARTERDLGTGTAHEEVTGGLTWYAHGHRAKLQLNYVLDRRTVAEDTTLGHAVVLQGMLGFR
jgi:phosphate-selective porin OprO and OprP